MAAFKLQWLPMEDSLYAPLSVRCMLRTEDIKETSVLGDFECIARTMTTDRHHPEVLLALAEKHLEMCKLCLDEMKANEKPVTKVGRTEMINALQKVVTGDHRDL